VTETFITLIATYGTALVFTITFLSCLAIPVPSSIVMLTAGGFAATGDLALGWVIGAAFIGAVLGDNAGYWIARASGTRFADWLYARPKRALAMAKGQAYMARWGGSSVFFSCWLAAPLGPYVNYISGLTRFDWMRFALWGMMGEVVWVGLYVGLGYRFADQLGALSSLLGNISGFVAAIVVAAGLGWWLWSVSRPRKDKS